MSVVSSQEFERNDAHYLCADYDLPVEATVCLEDKRVVLKDCLLSIKIVHSRRKFPDQAVVTLRARKTSGVTMEERNPSAWNTAEGYLPIDHATELFLVALKLINKYELSKEAKE